MSYESFHNDVMNTVHYMTQHDTREHRYYRPPSTALFFVPALATLGMPALTALGAASVLASPPGQWAVGHAYGGAKVVTQGLMAGDVTGAVTSAVWNSMTPSWMHTTPPGQPAPPSQSWFSWARAAPADALPAPPSALPAPPSALPSSAPQYAQYAAPRNTSGAMGVAAAARDLARLGAGTTPAALAAQVRAQRNAIAPLFVVVLTAAFWHIGSAKKRMLLQNGNADAADTGISGVIKDVWLKNSLGPLDAVTHNTLNILMGIVQVILLTTGSKIDNPAHVVAYGIPMTMCWQVLASLLRVHNGTPAYLASTILSAAFGALA